MKKTLNNWAIRASARLCELMAVGCLIVGLIACGRILAGNPRNSPTAGKPALTKPVGASEKASSSALQVAGEMTSR